MPFFDVDRLKHSREIPKDFPRIYLFGDSLTDRGFYEQNCGFGWRLREYYANRVEVINEGYPGATTRALRAHFKRQILDAAESNGPPAPVFITIFLGANDACLMGDNPLVPIPVYEEHIRHYVNSILECPATEGTKVILITPPPVDVSTPRGADLLENPAVASVLRTTAKEGRGNRTWESKRKFAKKIVEIGRDFEEKTDLVTVLDFWTAITKFGCQEHGDDFDQLDLDDLLPGSGMPGVKEFGSHIFIDGLHFGETGYKVLGDELLKTILAKWPELSKENFADRAIAVGLPHFLTSRKSSRPKV